MRQFAPQFLETLSFESHQDDDTVLEAIAVFRSLNAANRRKLPDNVPLDFVTDNWRRFVCPRVIPHDGRMSCACFRRCVTSFARATCTAHSRRYTDPETFLIPRATWPQLKADVCQELDLDSTGHIPSE